MLYIDEEQVIHITRGDSGYINFSIMKNDEPYTFQVGDIVRFKVFEKKACENVLLQKDFAVEEETELVHMSFDERDTKIGDVISKPTDYWYEVELNPDNDPQTVLGYDEDGAKV